MNNNRLQFTPRRQSQVSARERGQQLVMAIAFVFGLIFFLTAGLVVYAVGKGL